MFFTRQILKIYNKFASVFSGFAFFFEISQNPCLNAQGVWCGRFFHSLSQNATICPPAKKGKPKSKIQQLALVVRPGRRQRREGRWHAPETVQWWVVSSPSAPQIDQGSSPEAPPECCFRGCRSFSCQVNQRNFFNRIFAPCPYLKAN